MNSEKKVSQKSGLLLNKLKKVPIWAWMVILTISCAFGLYYRASVVVEGMVASMSLGIQTSVFFVITLIVAALAEPFVIRLFARVDYSIASRIYFRSTSYVPDFNLRKLPVKYEDFLIVVLFVYSLINIVTGIFGLLSMAFPYASYLLSIPANLFKIGCFVWSAFIMKPSVADWKMKNAFIALGLPSTIFLCFSLGVLI